MKVTPRIFLILITAAVIALSAAQWMLQCHLTPLIRKGLPAISRGTGLDWRIEGAAANLLARSASIAGLTAVLQDTGSTPPLLSVDRATVAIGWMSLLREILYIRNLSVENAHLVLIRQTDGTITLPGGPRTPPETGAIPEMPEPADRLPGETAPPVAKSPVLPKIALRKAAVSATMSYEDRTQGGGGLPPVAIDFTVVAEDLFTYGDLPPAEWGLLKLRSTSPTHPGAFAADLDIRLAPLTDPATASMAVGGRILDVRLRDFGNLTDATGVTGDSADITVQLDIREGVFLDGSRITVSLRNPELTGELRETHKRLSLPGSVTLIIPIRGTLATPAINIPQAITHSLLKTIADNPDHMLDQITIDGKPLRDRLRKRKKD